MKERERLQRAFGETDERFERCVLDSLAAIDTASVSVPRRRRLALIAALLVALLLLCAFAVAAQYGVLDFLIGGRNADDTVKSLVKPLNFAMEEGAVSLEINSALCDGESLALDWTIRNADADAPVYVQIDRWTVNGQQVWGDGSDGFDCQWLPGCYAPQGAMRDGEYVALPEEAKAADRLDVELIVGVYAPIAPIYEMEVFDAEPAEQKMREGYFVLAEGYGFVMEDPEDGYIHCFGRIDGETDRALAEQFTRRELRVVFNLDLGAAAERRVTLETGETYACPMFTAEYTKAVLTPVGLYLELAVTPSDATHDGVCRIFDGSFELTDENGAPLEMCLIEGEGTTIEEPVGSYRMHVRKVYNMMGVEAPGSVAVTYLDAKGGAVITMPLEIAQK